MRVSDGVWSWAERDPERTAIVDGDRRLTYRQVAAAVAQFGLQVQQAGLQVQQARPQAEQVGLPTQPRALRRGDRVAICLPNMAEYLICFLAAARYGFVAVTIPDRAAADDLSATIKTADPAVVITQPAPHGAEADHPSSHGAMASLLAHAAPRAIILAPAPIEEARSVAAEPPLADPSDPFYMGFTSGSTGRPKGVVRCHQAWVQSFAAASTAFGAAATERFLVPGPLHFSASLFAAIHTLEVGGTLYLERRFSPRRVARLIAQEAITGAFMVPTLYQALLGVAASPEPITLISCGEKLAPHLRAGLQERFPQARVIEYYGSSETGFLTVLPPSLGERQGSVGLPFPGVELEVRRPDGAVAALGEVGILQARSPMMATGYWDSVAGDGAHPGAGEGTHPGAEDSAHPRPLIPFTDAEGWFQTGDLAHIDRDGLLYLHGRADEAIITGGATLFPAEGEAVLSAHPAVAEAAVVGRAHPRRGEEVVAAVVLRPGATATKADLRAHCAAALPPYKRPRAILILPDLPRTESGKLSRKRLRERLNGTDVEATIE